MTINIMNQYIEITKKQINSYMRLVLGKKFIKSYQEEFLEKYIKIRYYNFYDDLENSTLRKKILNILKRTAEDLIIYNIEDREIIEIMCTFFYYNLYFDNVIYYKDLKEKISKIDKLRKRVFNKEEKDFKDELYNTIIEYNNQKEELLNRFETKEFILKVSNYPDKVGIYRINLKNNIEIPKVYSEYAKNKAFNIGIINEDKLIIEYYLTVIRIIKDIRKLNFKRQYIVEFADTILKKPQKLKKLLNVINNAAIQDKICMKIRYEKFMENKEAIYELMREGYKIAIILDDSFEVDFKNLESLDMFKFIIINKDFEKYKEFNKIKSKKIKNKLIEV